jgi:hypothetical protein
MQAKEPDLGASDSESHSNPGSCELYSPEKKINREKLPSLGVAIHDYNSSYSEGRRKRIRSSRPAWTKLVKSFLKSKKIQINELEVWLKW